jgi:hypothetical protein
MAHDTARFLFGRNFGFQASSSLPATWYMLKALLRANKCNKDAVKYIHGDGDEIV